MLFNAIVLFLLLGVVLSLYHALRHRTQNFLLLAASYVFYGAWDVRFLFLIAISTILDDICGLMIGEGELRRGDRLKTSALLVLASVLVLPWAARHDQPISRADALAGRSAPMPAAPPVVPEPTAGGTSGRWACSNASMSMRGHACHAAT